jgi:hypothetical protein
LSDFLIVQEFSMKFTKPLLITKLKATAVHLSLSLVVFVYLVYRIYYDWYPQPYFTIDGGWQGIQIIAAVDLVLGPLITFLIFDLSKGRREILFDLSVILIIQVAALFYGISQVYNQRPVAVALISQYMLAGTMEQFGGKLESASDLYRYSDERPPLVYADLQIDQSTMEELNELKLWESVLEYLQLPSKKTRSEFAVALKNRQRIFSDQLEALGAREAYEDWLRQNGKKADEVMIARIAGRYGEAWLVFDLDGKYRSYFY